MAFEIRNNQLIQVETVSTERTYSLDDLLNRKKSLESELQQVNDLIAAAQSLGIKTRDVLETERLADAKAAEDAAIAASVVETPVV